MNRNIKIHISDYRAAINDYYKKWRLTEEKLKDICVNEHISMEIILSKVLLIGRGFSTGIERHVQVNGNTGTQKAILLVARHFYKNRKILDKLISSIADCNDLNPDNIVKISISHGNLCKLLSKITRGEHYPVSFASKYLHFHNPCVPIYDQFASSQIKRWSDKKNTPEYSNTPICK